MSDSDFVDVGDELVVSISGYPVDKAYVFEVGETVKAALKRPGRDRIVFVLPLDFKNWDRVDGYGHHSQPLDGIGEPEL